MKFKSYFSFILLILFPLLGKAQFSFSGKLVAATDNSPVPGAHIMLDDHSKMISDQDGNFVFKNLPKGKHQLSVSFIGFKTYHTEISIPNQKELIISLTEAVYLSDEVVVKASRAGNNAPLTYAQVDGKTIEKTNLGSDLPYLLQTTPSLVVTSDAGTGIGYTGLRIRGSNETRINITMNGIPVNDAESHGVFFVDLPDLASSVDNIQVQRGIGTSSNGAAAFGASINIKTDASDEDAFAGFSTAAGSYNTIKETVRFGTGRSKKGFTLNGRLSKISSDGYVDRAHADLKSYYLSGAYSTPKTLLKFIVTGGYETTYQAWYGNPKDSLKTNRTYNPAGEITDAQGNITGYYPNQTDNYQQDYYQLHFAHKFNKKLHLSGALFLTKGKGYYENWKNNQKLNDYTLPPVELGDTTITHTDLVQQKWLDNQFYGVNAAAEYATGKVNFTLGGGWSQYDGVHFGVVSWARFASSGSNDHRWYTSTGLKTDANIYAKASYQLNSKLNAFADIQVRHIDHLMEGINDDLSNIDQHPAFTFVNPKAGLYYAINEKSSCYVSVAASNREPNRSVYRDADPGQVIKHEQLVDLELGYSLSTSRVRFSTNLFYMDYTNQLVLTGKINNVGAAIMTNVPKSYRAGIENSLTWLVSGTFDLGFNLSLSQNKIKQFTEYVDNWNYWDDPDNQPYQYSFDLGTTDISFSPSVVTGLNLHYQPSSALGVNLLTSYVSRQFLDNTSNKDRSLDPYVVSNMRIAYTVKQSIFQTLEFSLALNNLFSALYETNGWVYKYYYDQQAYTMDGYFPQAPFHWMLGMNIRF